MPTSLAIMNSILLTISAFIAIAATQDYPQATQYTDSNTGISFTGYADGTGFQFGIALPQSPTTDFVAQLVSPLTNGAGWAGVDFGESMAGHLLLVAWPNNGDVVIAPRFATGYEVSQTTSYASTALSLSPIAMGTFVNATHVSATFVCGGCMNSDSFTAGNASGTFAYAYSSLAVANPSNPNSLLSDHTSADEPYGPFQVDLSAARSSQYDTWAALAAGDGGDVAGNSTATTSGLAPTSTGAAAPAKTSGGSSTGTSPAAQQGAGGEGDQSTTAGAGVVVLCVLLGFAYMAQLLTSL